MYICSRRIVTGSPVYNMTGLATGLYDGVRPAEETIIFWPMILAREKTTR